MDNPANPHVSAKLDCKKMQSEHSEYWVGV